MADIFMIFFGVLGIFSVAGLSVYKTKKELDSKMTKHEGPEIIIYRNGKA